MERAKQENFIKKAEASGTIVYEQHGKLYIVRKPSQWTTVAIFVSALLTLILILNGLLQFIAGNNSIIAGLVLFASGLFTGLLLVLLIRYNQKIKRLPASEMLTVCVLDIPDNKILDGKNNFLSDLSCAVITRQFQITSSSPALVLKAGKKTLLLVKGSPFSGGIKDVEEFLQSALKQNS